MMQDDVQVAVCVVISVFRHVIRNTLEYYPSHGNCCDYHTASTTAVMVLCRSRVQTALFNGEVDLLFDLNVSPGTPQSKIIHQRSPSAS